MPDGGRVLALHVHYGRSSRDEWLAKARQSGVAPAPVESLADPAMSAPDDLASWKRPEENYRFSVQDVDRIPVHLPGPAAISGKSLFQMRFPPSHFDDDTPHD